jgi:hypothetical protein
MHGEFLLLLFLQAHRETEAHFTATGMPSQRNQSDSFCFKRAAFFQSLKSKVGLAAAKAAALRINLNVEGCGNRFLLEGSYCASTRAGMTRARSINMVSCKRRRCNLPPICPPAFVLLVPGRQRHFPQRLRKMSLL